VETNENIGGDNRVQSQLKIKNRNLKIDPPFLLLQDLCKGYQEGEQTRVVLHETTLEIAKGEFIAILGKSGSGKTTLLNLISGIDRVDCGEIWLEGRNLTDLDDQQRTLFRRRNIGFVFQFFNLIPTLTVWENVLLPLELNGTADQTGKERVRELLAIVGLLERSKAFPDRLSGGEQQRVAIVRALVHDPALVLADEPTGNLDEDTGKQVMGILDRLVRQAGKNLILVTHSSEAAGYADRAFSLREGHLLQIPVHANGRE
jgi:putative ABC transport system ATP-binding protein